VSSYPSRPKRSVAARRMSGRFAPLAEPLLLSLAEFRLATTGLYQAVKR